MTVTTSTTPETKDAVPGAAPFKISRIEPKDKVTVTYKASAEAGDNVVYLHLRLTGSNRLGGTKLDHLGVVCGLNNRCGEPGSVALKAATNGSVERKGVIIDDSLLVSEGEYEVTADALGSAGSWA